LKWCVDGLFTLSDMTVHHSTAVMLHVYCPSASLSVNIPSSSYFFFSYHHPPFHYHTSRAHLHLSSPLYPCSTAFYVKTLFDHLLTLAPQPQPPPSLTLNLNLHPPPYHQHITNPTTPPQPQPTSHQNAHQPRHHKRTLLPWQGPRIPTPKPTDHQPLLHPTPEAQLSEAEHYIPVRDDMGVRCGAYCGACLEG
jgi:hypothetical protein